MPPRVFLSLASLAFVALGGSAGLAAPPLPPAPSPPPPPATSAARPEATSAPAPAPAPDSAPAPATDSVSAPPPLAAPPPAPPGAAPPPWMWRPPPRSNVLYPGWRLEEDLPPGQTDKPKWYGWQSLIGIIPSHGLALLGSFDNDTQFLIVAGAMGHALSSPIVHWVHGNAGRGFLSLGLNIGLPLLGYGVAASFRSTEMLFATGLLTIIGWPIVDTVVLSYEDPPQSKSKNKSAGLIHSFGVVPMIDGEKKGLSLVGQF